MLICFVYKLSRIFKENESREMVYRREKRGFGRRASWVQATPSHTEKMASLHFSLRPILNSLLFSGFLGSQSALLSGFFCFLMGNNLFLLQEKGEMAPRMGYKCDEKVTSTLQIENNVDNDRKGQEVKGSKWPPKGRDKQEEVKE